MSAGRQNALRVSIVCLLRTKLVKSEIKCSGANVLAAFSVPFFRDQMRLEIQVEVIA